MPSSFRTSLPRSTSAAGQTPFYSDLSWSVNIISHPHDYSPGEERGKKRGVGIFGICHRVICVFKCFPLDTLSRGRRTLHLPQIIVIHGSVDSCSGPEASSNCNHDRDGNATTRPRRMYSSSGSHDLPSELHRTIKHQAILSTILITRDTKMNL